MRKIITTFTLLLCLVFTSLASASPTPRTITVNGTSTITALPDMATVDIRIITTGKTSTIAQSDNARIANDVRTKLTALGVHSADIDSSDFSLSPQYGEAKNRPAPIVGYTARHTLTVTVRDLSLFSRSIDTALSCGASQLGNITYDCQDKNNLQMQALANAAREAKQKATTLATALGEPDVQLLSITESGISTTPYRIRYAKDNLTATGSESTELSINDIRITATVTAVFTLPVR